MDEADMVLMLEMFWLQGYFRHPQKVETVSPEEVAHIGGSNLASTNRGINVPRANRHRHGGHDYPLPQPQPVQNTIPHPRQIEIVTPREVAQRLQVPEPWVYEKTRTRCKNPLPCVRIGRFIRFDWFAVLDWWEKQSSK